MTNLAKTLSDKLLRACSDIKISSDDNYQLVIQASDKNGFNIYLEEGDTENTLFFEGYHQHFDNSDSGIEEMSNILGYGISNFGRLTAYSKGKKEFKWSFDIFDDSEEEWINVGTTVNLSIRPWKRTKIRHYQNCYVEMDKHEDKTSG